MIMMKKYQSHSCEIVLILFVVILFSQCNNLSLGFTPIVNAFRVSISQKRKEGGQTGTQRCFVHVADNVQSACKPQKGNSVFVLSMWSDNNDSNEIDSRASPDFSTQININPPSDSGFRMELFNYLSLPSVEVWNSLAVVLCSFLVAVSTLQSLPPIPTSAVTSFLHLPSMNDIDVYHLIDVTLNYFNVVFAVDFFARWYAIGNFKPKYLTNALVVLDIFIVLVPLFLGAFFPFTVRDTPGIQNLLLLRVLRLRRVLTDITTFKRFEMALGVPPQDIRPFQLQLARVLLSIFTLLSVSTGLIYSAEHNVNPAFPDYFSALYFGITTLTTVGFGDIAPITPNGRLVVCASIFLGVAIIPAQAASLLDAILQFQEDRKQEKGDVNVTMETRQLVTEIEVATTKEQQTQVDLGKMKNVLDSSLPVVPQVEEKSVSRIHHFCPNCERKDHRKDACYCWFCGSKLLK